jgi:CHASE3 domain sensor protein
MPVKNTFFALLRQSLTSGHFRSAGAQFMGVALVLLLSGMVMLGSDINALNGHFRQVLLTTNVLGELDNIERENVGIEHSVRGLALTGRPEFTRYFVMRRNNLRFSIKALNTVADDCRLDKRQIRSIDKMLAKRLAALEPYAFDPKRAQTDVARLIVDPAFRNYQHQTDLMVTAMKRETTRILMAEQEATRQKLKETYREAFTIVAIAFLLSALGLFLNFSGPSVRSRRKPE